MRINSLLKTLALLAVALPALFCASTNRYPEANNGAFSTSRRYAKLKKPADRGAA
jgi:hypothetical protein